MRHPRHVLVVLTSLACACMPATGQPTDSPCAEGGPHDSGCDDSIIELTPITVTATRRESPLERVPVSVTALSGERLRQMGALDFGDYARSVPGLSFTDAGFGGQRYVIRGVSTDILGESRSTTSIYLDETPITDGSFGRLFYSPNPVLVDIDRVEVLRGPQGTLFGSGSMGGAIRIITRQPDTFDTQGFVEAGLSSTAHGGPGYELQGMVNAPLSEGRAALRGVAYYRNLDGWIDNTVLGNRNVNDNETVGLRVAGLWSDSERLTVNAKVAYQDRESHGNGFDQDDPPWTQQRQVPEPNSDDWTLLNFDVDYRFDRTRLISATSWMDRTVRFDGDATAAYPIPGIAVTGTYRSEQKDLVQEFRLQSIGDERLDWLLGLFYQDQNYRLDHEILLPNVDGAPFRLLAAHTDRPTEQTAAFGDLIYRFGDHWQGTIGGRWFRFQHSSDSSATGPVAGPGTSRLTRASETGFTPKFGLSYVHDANLMVYGTLAGGYRPGGHNETLYDQWPACRPYLDWLGLSGVPPTYESDSVWSYELGIKTHWASQQVHLNAAVFHLDWSDMQTLAWLPCQAQWEQNAGEATSKGAEIELVAYPGRNFELRLNGAWTDARLDEEIFLLGGRDGDRVPGVPEYAFGGALTWFFEAFDAAKGSARVDYQYVGSSPNAFSLWFVPNEIPSYSLVNLRLGLDRGRWSASLYLDNLFDERAIISVFDAPEHWVTTARPFAVGVSLRFTY